VLENKQRGGNRKEKRPTCLSPIPARGEPAGKRNSEKKRGGPTILGEVPAKEGDSAGGRRDLFERHRSRKNPQDQRGHFKRGWKLQGKARRKKKGAAAGTPIGKNDGA